MTGDESRWRRQGARSVDIMRDSMLRRFIDGPRLSKMGEISKKGFKFIARRLREDRLAR